MVAIGVLSMLNAFFVIVIFRQVGQAYLGYRPARSRDGLPLGSAVPSWHGVASGTGMIGASDFAGRSHIILFAEPSCAPCRKLMPEFVRAERDLLQPIGLPAVVIASEDEDENRLFGEQYGIESPLVIHAEREIARRFRVYATPWAYGVGVDGRIAWKGFVNSEADLARLVESLDPEPLLADSETLLVGATFTNGGGPHVARG